MASSHPSDQQYFQKRQVGDSQHQQPGHLIAVAISLLFGLGYFAAFVGQHWLPPAVALVIPLPGCLPVPLSSSMQLVVGRVNHRNWLG